MLPKTPVQELRALDPGSWSENEDKQMNSPESADDQVSRVRPSVCLPERSPARQSLQLYRDKKIKSNWAWRFWLQKALDILQE